MGSDRLHGVRGHDAAQASLVRAIERGKLHHGLILVGPRGVGKARLALALGAALHCPVAPARGCGSCNVCRRIASGMHAGVEWVRPEDDRGTIKVATARELSTHLEMAPFEGEHHLVVFDPADALSEEAFNALLKTIEEPRPGVHVVMITTQLDALLPTILSRCLAVRLGRLPDDDVRAIVAERLEARDDDTDEITPARVELAVRLAWGSAGLAVELALDPTLEPAMALLGQLIHAADHGPSAIFSGDKSPLWVAWANAVGPAKTGRPARERGLAARCAELWLLHLSEALRGREGLPSVPRVERSTPTLLRQIDIVQTFLESIDRNPKVRLSLENTLLSLSRTTRASV